MDDLHHAIATAARPANLACNVFQTAIRDSWIENLRKTAISGDLNLLISSALSRAFSEV
jgi:hypothetical protein